jgi:thiamine biosynthesis lipoprotein
MHLVELDPQAFTVRFQRSGMMLDLGAIGKGFAVDRAAEVLREAVVTSALIHGGTSTVLAIGTPTDAPSWKIAVEYPRAHPDKPAPLLAEIELHNESLSTSAIWGKCFQKEGRTFGHVLDPRSGEPVQAALLATVVAPTATETDALSTALLTLGISGLEAIRNCRPAARALVMAAGETGRLITAATGLALYPLPHSARSA